MRAEVAVPLIASGGAGEVEHFAPAVGPARTPCWRRACSTSASSRSARSRTRCAAAGHPGPLAGGSTLDARVSGGDIAGTRRTASSGPADLDLGVVPAAVTAVSSSAGLP